MPAKPHPHAKPGTSSNAAAPARREAFTILLELDRSPSTHSDDLLRGRRVTALSPQDRNLTTTLVMGTVRWQLALDAQVQPLLSRPNTRLDPEIRIALRLGAFQLLHLDRIPVHAAINESVALAKSTGNKFAAGMVNAILRKIAAQPKSGPSTEAAYPAWLVERWTANYGPEATRRICDYGQQQPETAIRLSTPQVESELEKSNPEQGISHASGQGIELAPGAILAAARRVLSGDITATEAFHTGKLRIQDEGSQLIAELAGHGIRILDACAAPGGKTLILAERNPKATLTANELNPARLEALQRRIREAYPEAKIQFQQSDAAELAPGDYDLVLADVPCSGTGTLNRNPEIRHRLQPEDLARHHQRQCAILRGALRACAHNPTARVLYSTCSLEPEENAQVISELLAESPGWRQTSLADQIQKLSKAGSLTPSAAKSMAAQVAPDGSLTLLPGSLGPEALTDGFFLAMLEKRQ